MTKLLQAAKSNPIVDNGNGEKRGVSMGSKDNPMNLDNSGCINDKKIGEESTEPNMTLRSSNDDGSLISFSKSIPSQDSSTSLVNTPLTSASLPIISNTSDPIIIKKALITNEDL